MPEKKRSYPTPDKWAHRRVITVDLDEDLQVDFRLPDLGVWIAQGKIPNPLRSMAETLEFGMVQVEALEPEDRVAFYDLQAFIVATHLVKPDLVASMGGEEEAIEWVKNEMPPAHRDMLWMRAFHIVSGDMLSSITDLLRFREEPAGSAAATGGPQGLAEAQ